MFRILKALAPEKSICENDCKSTITIRKTCQIATNLQPGTGKTSSCGDLAQFRPTRKRRAKKNCIIRTTPTVPEEQKTEKVAEPWRIRACGNRVNWPGVEAAGLSGVTARPGPGVLSGSRGGTAGAALVPPAWGAPGWRGWAHCGALWCFPHWSSKDSRASTPSHDRATSRVSRTASRMRLLSSCASFTLFPTAPSRTLRTQMLSKST
jgi:hypothetical protein